MSQNERCEPAENSAGADAAGPYVVEFGNEGGAWTANVRGLADARTWSQTREGLEHAVRELIALVEDLPPGAEHMIELVWHPIPPRQVPST